MERVSMQSRKEIITRHKKKYEKAHKKEKSEILDNVCSTIGLSRGHVARMLRQKSHDKKQPTKRRGRKPQYTENVVIQLLEKLWVQMDCICGKRLRAGLSDMVDALVRHGELNAPEWVIKKLLSMSAATIDRLLAPIRQKMQIRGRNTTKPGSLRKKDIPIRVGNQWEENKPGYIEMDLVAHCGETASGDYINTLDMTDIYSGWTETIAVQNKAQVHVFSAIKAIRARLPFTLRGLDSDNGSEFINDQLYRYCLKENLVFTRSRPYNKNDNCHVEQKNYTVIRKQIGYARYEGVTTVKIFNKYYELLRLYGNFFLPSVKLIKKERNGARVYKKYDAPLTPFERLMQCEDVTDEQKNVLLAQIKMLNPAALKRDMMSLQEQILSMAVQHNQSKQKLV